MRKFINSIPASTLVVISVLLSLAPYPFEPEPHLIEKLKMLAAGILVKPLDIFDLLMHSTPIILLTLKLTLKPKENNDD